MAAKVFNRVMRQWPDYFDFIPKTYVIPQQNEEIQDMKTPHIVKPASGSEGCGIFLVKKFKDIPSYCFTQDHIVQSYLMKPALLLNKKFDLRIYVMVTSLQPLQAFINTEGLVRVCTEEYSKPSKDNMHKLLSHLTNYTLNKMSTNYVHADEA